ncbi:MAG: hypothetical protein M1829_000749 [Trizodia sp. TS-e1964]|nr:MAG: hypothetical protein M1829_000749 [Trizodia sp. TS-e1964]
MSAQSTTFPTLQPSEFLAACEALANRYDAADHTSDAPSARWKEVGRDTQYLKIARVLPSPPEGEGEAEAEAEEEQEQEIDDPPDEAALQRSAALPNAVVEYSIVLSPTYRVPVLYFSLHNSSRAPRLEAVYEALVPLSMRGGLRSVGVLGGLSRGDHPITGRPAFFVHPCNTAAAMQALVGAEGVPVEEYLVLWLGVVGGCVGLCVPAGVAAGGGGF